MQDLQFSSPAKRDAFRANIAKHQAKIKAKQALANVPPVHENGALACDDPRAPGASVGHPSKPIGQSNLDLTGRRIVKRGDLVSWNGFRGRVARVRMGSAYPEQGSPLYINVGAFVACRSVQVVA